MLDHIKQLLSRASYHLGVAVGELSTLSLESKELKIVSEHLSIIGFILDQELKKGHQKLIKFRFHRGSLKDSMATATVVRDKEELFQKILSAYGDLGIGRNIRMI